MTLLWLRGLATRRGGRLMAAATGVAIAVALLACLGNFIATSKATMTERAANTVPVDWQIETQQGANKDRILIAAKRAAGDLAALPVPFGTTSGFVATTGGTTQTTGPGQVLGLPSGYRSTFPGEIRTLIGADTGVLLAQQTAANLHVSPGDKVRIRLFGQRPTAVTVAGVVELPQADSLFQKVGAPSQSQPVAPPDNVMLLPRTLFPKIFGAMEKSRPDLVRHQVHVKRTHALPADPAAAFTQVVAAGHNFEATVSGAALVGNNLGAALDSARSDALYSQVLFLFLGTPGAALGAALTAALAGATASRRRREQALLRTRGASRSQLLRLASLEAVVIGVVGGAIGIALAALVGYLEFGSVRFGATTTSALIWMAVSLAVGLGVAAATVLLPVRRDLRMATTTETRVLVGRERGPVWTRFGLDFVLLAVSLAVFYATSRSQYSLVLAPEGVPTISVNYWAFLGPALLWVGSALLVWRLTDLVLARGRSGLTLMLRPVAGSLSGTVAASLSRQRRTITRSVVLIALAISFALSTSTFNATYRQQAEADAQLTNGADVTVTESPGAVLSLADAGKLATVPGVNAAESIQHRYAYVGADLQDLYGVDPATISSATALQDAYFQGGTTQQLMSRLAAQPDGVLVSAETVTDFQLHTGDTVNLRLQDSRTKKLTTVPFHYIGVVNEFPTAPKDSFLLANAGYVAARTGSNAVGAILIDTASSDVSAVARRIRDIVGTSATVTDINSTRAVVGSSLTAVDLSGLTKVELAFAVGLVAAAGGLVLALGLAERRRTFAIAAALGARPRQLAGFIVGEAALVAGFGLVGGVIAGWALSEMLVKVLTGVFDPPPSSLAVPWTYLVVVAGITLGTIALAAAVAARRSRLLAIEQLREL